MTRMRRILADGTREDTNLLSVYIRSIRPIRDEKDAPRFDIDPEEK
jgi:hypothetical protein